MECPSVCLAVCLVCSCLSSRVSCLSSRKSCQFLLSGCEVPVCSCHPAVYPVVPVVQLCILIVPNSSCSESRYSICSSLSGGITREAVPKEIVLQYCPHPCFPLWATPRTLRNHSVHECRCIENSESPSSL